MGDRQRDLPGRRDGDFDDETPAPVDPEARPPRPGTSDDRSRQSRALRRMEELGAKLDQHAARFDEHADRDEAALAKLDLTLEAHSAVLGTVRESQAALRATLDAISIDMAHQRELQRTEAAAEAQVDLEQARLQREAMPWKYKVILAVIALISSAIGAAVAVLAK